MIIIQCELLLNSKDFSALWESIARMAVTGVVLLPPGCTLVNEVPPDTEVVVVKKKEV